MESRIHILYATETGNAESLAQRASDRATNEGWHAIMESLSEVHPRDLVASKVALIIVSTWGDGDPPTEAEDFWADLEKSQEDLSRLQYAVLGLGDSGYVDFCGFARKLDARLQELGARCLHERVEADVDYDDTYAEWEARVFPLLDQLRATPADAR